MFSGKTTRLLQRIAEWPSREVVAIKHARDRRYAEAAIVSHGGQRTPCRGLTDLRALESYLTVSTHWVAIDEGHFFGPELIDVVSCLRARSIGCIITALDRNSWGKPFAPILSLLRLADDPYVLRARCARCGRAANRTQRLTPIRNGDLVGGIGDYEPRCARCWRPPPEQPPEGEA